MTSMADEVIALAGTLGLPVTEWQRQIIKRMWPEPDTATYSAGGSTSNESG